MEELKILVEMVAKLPQMALWVVAAYFFYKLSIVGSIYATIRFLGERAYQWAVAKKGERVVEHGSGVYLITIEGRANAKVIEVLKSVAGVSTAWGPGAYIHWEDALWLEQAVAEKRAREKARV